MNWKEKWKDIEELPGGGQGKVYRVINNSDFLTSTHQLLEQFRNLTSSISDQTKYLTRIEALRKNLQDFLAFSDIHNQFVLKELLPPELRRDSGLAVERMEREIHAIKILTDADSPNIIKLVDHDDTNLWFVTKYYPKKSLSNNRNIFIGNALFTLNKVKELLTGLSILHEKFFIHRDIKPDNIFLDNFDRLVLGDFGLIYYGENKSNRLSRNYDNVGSRDWEPLWAQGKLLLEVKPTFDIFSIGKVIWYMISGKEILPAYYYDDDEYNLENLFPDKPEMEFVNHLFSSIIVEREKDCIESVKKLDELIQFTIEEIEKYTEPLNFKNKRVCTVCKKGYFIPISKGNQIETEKFGISSGGMRKHLVFECSYCGYVQIFSYKNYVPSAWINEKSLSIKKTVTPSEHPVGR